MRTGGEREDHVIANVCMFFLIKYLVHKLLAIITRYYVRSGIYPNNFTNARFRTKTEI